MRVKRHMFHFVLVLLLILLGFTFATEQQGDIDPVEYYFRFSIQSRSELDLVTRVVSIDNVIGTEVYAYANKYEFQQLKDLGYEIEILQHPGTLIIPKMAESVKDIEEWDYYPTYEAYVSMMYQFQSSYPTICKIENVGSSVEGRDILFAIISDNINVEESEPEFMYTSTMHGDETTGYILMLRLIDYILTHYGNDSRITHMVNNAEIWINPLANPDGTYHSGNNTVYGAIRYNANGVDLNRNFPDPDDGEHPDGNAWQPETIIMMDLAAGHNFIHSTNFHSGEEVVNYPWDTWAHLHADDEWYQVISREYADTVHAHSPSTYMDGFDDGITNGYQWYSISGGRQDYMNYYYGCREVTIELSETKLLPASQLPAHWEYNWRSLLNYIENIFSGIRGNVTSISGVPIDATITIVGHDFDNSHVYSDSDLGDYYRMCLAGSYDLLFEAEGYYPKTVENAVVSDEAQTVVNVQLNSLPNTPVLVFDGHSASQVDPGDNISFKIFLKNVGIATAYNVQSYISTADPYINITVDNSYFPNINPQESEQSNSNFEFSVSPQCPEDYYATINIYFSCTGFDTIDAFEIPVGVNRVLVWDLDQNHNSGTRIESSLQRLSQETEYSTSSLPTDLSIFGAVFICLGIYSDNSELPETSVNPLTDYLDNGGRIYMEGGETWYYDTQTALHSYFGINGAADGSGDTDGILGCDTTFMEGITFAYQGDNSYMDHLEPAGNAYPIFENQSPQYMNGIARIIGNYKSVGVSFEFGGIPSTEQDSVMLRYLEFFNMDTTSGGVQCVPGDVNSDGSINVTDIVRIVQFVLDMEVPDAYESCAADWNHDGLINVQDIVGIVYYILHSD